MHCTREFEFVTDPEGGYAAYPSGMDGATEGNTLMEAVQMSADWLREHAVAELEPGRVLPQEHIGNAPRRGGKVLTIAIQADVTDVPAVTAVEAAARLGVSRARVA